MYKSIISRKSNYLYLCNAIRWLNSKLWHISDMQSRNSSFKSTSVIWIIVLITHRPESFNNSIHRVSNVCSRIEVGFDSESLSLSSSLSAAVSWLYKESSNSYVICLLQTLTVNFAIILKYSITIGLFGNRVSLMLYMSLTETIVTSPILLSHCDANKGKCNT